MCVCLFGNQSDVFGFSGALDRQVDRLACTSLARDGPLRSHLHGGTFARLGVKHGRRRSSSSRSTAPCVLYPIETPPPALTHDGTHTHTHTHTQHARHDRDGIGHVQHVQLTNTPEYLAFAVLSCEDRREPTPRNSLAAHPPAATHKRRFVNSQFRPTARGRWSS